MWGTNLNNIQACLIQYHCVCSTYVPCWISFCIDHMLFFCMNLCFFLKCNHNVKMLLEWCFYMKLCFSLKLHFWVNIFFKHVFCLQFSINYNFAMFHRFVFILFFCIQANLYHVLLLWELWMTVTRTWILKMILQWLHDFLFLSSC